MRGFQNLLYADPFKIRKRTPRYRNAYGICVSIPALLGFALVFFLIFFMSPRGRNMRKYQKEIFTWNKNHMPEHI
jgi:ribosomal protein S30